MKKIEECLQDWFEKKYGLRESTVLIENHTQILKEAFIAGYNQAIEDRKKIEGIR